MNITHAQAKALAAFIHTVRPDWGPDGITTALGQARELTSLETLTGWAVRAALNPANRTPAVIAMPGPHRDVPRPGLATIHQYDRGRTCSICSEHQDRCQQIWKGDHEFMSIPQAIKLATTATKPGIVLPATAAQKAAGEGTKPRGSRRVPRGGPGGPG